MALEHCYRDYHIAITVLRQDKSWPKTLSPAERENGNPDPPRSTASPLC